MDRPMGRWAISLLTAMAVFWHTVAGCCAHHAHAASSGATLPAAASPQPAPPASVARTSHRHSGRCCHSRHHKPVGGNAAKPDRQDDSRHRSPSGNPCPCRGSDCCDEGSCAFVLTKSAELPHFTLDGVAFLAPAAVATLISASSVATSSSHPGQLEVWWPESLRAHLFLLNLRN